MCEVCGEQLGYIVHHIIPLTSANISDVSISLNHDNLRYECKDCHDQEDAHAFVRKKKLLCKFDNCGQPYGTPPSCVGNDSA
ncbi:MAG: HNH endonuclease [Acutalibacteraceae bacterium]